MSILHWILSPSWHPAGATLAGVVALGVYTAEMEVDMAVTGNRFSDVRFIEGLLPTEADESAMGAINRPLLAWIIHLLNGVLLAQLYAAVFKRFLPGPDWLKGVIFGEAFIVSVWWLTPLADKYHPLIKSGVLPPLANWTSFLQNIVRHFCFGLTLGLLYRD
ncbi:MAG TPA: DUF6789 family protein [Ktedonobacteraceae bacterium]|nr:DUF6789 family protein [Ktedonobacteraceae bacterium]